MVDCTQFANVPPGAHLPVWSNYSADFRKPVLGGFTAKENDASRPRQRQPRAAAPCGMVPGPRRLTAATRSGRAAGVVTQNPAEALAADDFAYLAADLFAGLDQPIL